MPGYGYFFDKNRKSPNKRNELLLLSLKTGNILTTIDMSCFPIIFQASLVVYRIYNSLKMVNFCAFLVRRQRFGVQLYSEMWVFNTSSWRSTLWNVPFGGMVSHLFCW